MAEQRVQRRLTAILAADVVGYSRMMSDDEVGTLAQLKIFIQEVFDPCFGITLGMTSLAPSGRSKIANSGLDRLACSQFPNVGAFLMLGRSLLGNPV